MEGLNKFTEYTVRVLAINRYGPGTASETVSVTTQSDGEFYLNITPNLSSMAASYKNATILNQFDLISWCIKITKILTQILMRVIDMMQAWIT